jgi:hypothetical protein
MTSTAFFKEDVLPGVLIPHAFYFVPHPNGTMVESYLTDAAGVARQINGQAMIEAFAGPVVAAQISQMNRVERVANIAARNALAGANFNQMVLVIDATGDATVASGSALYYFHNADNSWTKVAEYEAMDVIVQWNSIAGRPASAPASIDDAVNKRHTHANLASLDKIGEDGSGNMTFNGALVGGSNWGATDW